MQKCGQKTEIYSRVVGYFSPLAGWNRGKKEEFSMRKTINLDSDMVEDFQNKVENKKKEETENASLLSVA